MKFDLFKNKHAGERCFILGNAPSLAEENLSLLKNEQVFVCNRGYVATDIGLDHYDYYVIADQTTYNVYADEIRQRVSCPRFYASHIVESPVYCNGVGEENIIFKKPNTNKHQIRTHGRFPNSFDEGWGKTSTVVFEAALIAYFMGFKEIYFLGADFFYNADANYFFKSENEVIGIKNGHSPKYLNECTPRFNIFFQSKNIKFINLSKGFKIKNLMATGTLEDVIHGQRHKKS